MLISDVEEELMENSNIIQPQYTCIRCGGSFDEDRMIIVSTIDYPTVIVKVRNCIECLSKGEIINAD